MPSGIDLNSMKNIKDQRLRSRLARHSRLLSDSPEYEARDTVEIEE